MPARNLGGGMKGKLTSGLGKMKTKLGKLEGGVEKKFGKFKSDMKGLRNEAKERFRQGRKPGRERLEDSDENEMETKMSGAKREKRMRKERQLLENKQRVSPDNDIDEGRARSNRRPKAGKHKFRKMHNSGDENFEDDYEGNRHNSMSAPLIPGKRNRRIVPKKPMAIGKIKYRVLAFLAYVLVLIAVIEIAFIPIGDRLSRRYAWDKYEPNVVALLVFLGLSSSCATFLFAFLNFSQLSAIKQTAEISGILIIFMIIAVGVDAILFLYAVAQYFAAASLFGSKFLNLIENYNSDYDDKVTMDRIQIEFQCCGLLSFENWELASETLGYDFIPFSCCNPLVLRPCAHDSTRIQTELPNGEDSTIYTKGCRGQMQGYYAFLVSFVIWIALLSLLVKSGLLIICYLMYKRK